MSNRIQGLFDLGQSVWCDNLSRRIVDSGELRRLIDLGVVGVTSNPTIFMKAIAGSRDYDRAFQSLVETGEEDVLAIYERLVLPDIADAADLLLPVYERTNRQDGYVSMEVNPRLAYDTRGTIDEAQRLFAELDRPNVMIKVPATREGIPAVEALIAEGISVNATLIFSVAMHERVMAAYLAGLKRLDARGGDLSTVASVASFFVSRVDTMVDKLLEDRRADGANVDGFFGKAAIANAVLAYERFLAVFAGSGDFGPLASRGARVQRPLWASTSTKNPAYPDTIYVDNLVGRHTVNTMPPQTLEAALDHGSSHVTLGHGAASAEQVMSQLGRLGIDMQAVTEQLLREGVDAFAGSFDELLANLSAKQEQFRAVM